MGLHLSEPGSHDVQFRIPRFWQLPPLRGTGRRGFELDLFVRGDAESGKVPFSLATPRGSLLAVNVGDSNDFWRSG